MYARFSPARIVSRQMEHFSGLDSRFLDGLRFATRGELYASKGALRGDGTARALASACDSRAKMQRSAWNARCKARMRSGPRARAQLRRADAAEAGRISSDHIVTIRTC